jgi:hypothetical protein
MNDEITDNEVDMLKKKKEQLTPSIEETKLLKAKLRNNIMLLIRNFENLTGAKVSEINLEHVEVPADFQSNSLSDRTVGIEVIVEV